MRRGPPSSAPSTRCWRPWPRTIPSWSATSSASGGTARSASPSSRSSPTSGGRCRRPTWTDSSTPWPPAGAWCPRSCPACPRRRSSGPPSSAVSMSCATTTGGGRPTPASCASLYAPLDHWWRHEGIPAVGQAVESARRELSRGADWTRMVGVHCAVLQERIPEIIERREPVALAVCALFGKGLYLDLPDCQLIGLGAGLGELGARAAPATWPGASRSSPTPPAWPSSTTCARAPAR